ncbi:MAG: hypothetical protein CME64_05575 [Halobacteriovoraceae bacterium]|nr:hypothetical protein [Halobacteriovoraceae bacterium]
MPMTHSTLSSYSDDEILSMRIKDLPLDSRPLFDGQLSKLRSELKRRGIEWMPHVWPSEEWFSPDGVGGFAFPFTLLDSKLIKLEKKHVGLSEGSNEKEFLKLIRHECAHALDNAFHLRKIKSRQRVFGLSSTPYPSYYIPKQNSREYVKHLPQGYAQAHPEEDWAETFAVWLTPKNQWKKKYANWPALEKLMLVDNVMDNLRGLSPKINRKDTPLHFKDDERTVREYFSWRKKSLGLRQRNFYENKVNELFSIQGRKHANEVFKRYESIICSKLVKRSGIDRNVAKLMIKELKQECKSKNYHLKYSSIKTKRAVEDVLAAHSADFLKKKRHRVFM